MLQQAVTFNSHVCDFTPLLFMTLLCTEHIDKYYLHKLPVTMESFYKMKHLKASHMTEWLILVLSLFSIWKDI